MFKNKAEGANNICCKRIAELRKAVKPKMSQRALAEKMQIEGVDFEKNAIQRIEAGKRFVTDIEIAAFARVFKVSTDYLLGLSD